MKRTELHIESSRSCVTCNGPTTLVRRWYPEDLRRLYGKTKKKLFPPDLQLHEYEMLKCDDCGLVFAFPQIPGDAHFYSWVSREESGYYVCSRWEWDRVLEVISRHDVRRVLEVGCGTGRFLALLKAERGINGIGLDTANYAISRARQEGLEVHCLTLEEFVTENPAARFDMICAYHCLEHVPDPLRWMTKMAEILRPNGLLVVSVPYSPTTWEALGWTYLNLPPHHLTRWNYKSLERLGEMLGLQVTIEAEPYNLASFKRLFWQFLHLTGGPTGRFKGFLRCCVHPLKFLRLAAFGYFRERDPSGARAGDVVLAVYRCRTDT